jgi:hypothetical protein
MRGERTKNSLRLPKTLAYTALRVAVAGVVSCHSDATPPIADASIEAAANADAGDARDECPLGGGCTPRPGSDASCPQEVCDMSECPAEAGCEFI